VPLVSCRLASLALALAAVACGPSPERTDERDDERADTGEAISGEAEAAAPVAPSAHVTPAAEIKERLTTVGGELQIVEERDGETGATVKVVYLDDEPVHEVETFTGELYAFARLGADLVVIRYCGASYCGFDLIEVSEDGSHAVYGHLGNGLEGMDILVRDWTLELSAPGYSHHLGDRPAVRYRWQDGRLTELPAE
jgi:hypothetical protein